VSGRAAPLVDAGMTVEEALRKDALFSAAERALGRPCSRGWFVPGRIEVLGKHTDYAGGPSLVCAAERGICAVAVPRPDRVVRVMDAKWAQAVELSLSPDVGIHKGWANYAATVVRRVARNFPDAGRGVDIAFAGDLPQSAGLSSSSALMIAIFIALADANRLANDRRFIDTWNFPERLAGYLACIENGQSYGEYEGDRGVGTFGGSEDHTAILCSRSGHLSQYRFSPARLERQVALPDEWAFVIASSGVESHKTGAARDLYNRASLAAKAVLETWNAASHRSDVTLDLALRHAPGAAEKVREALSNADRRDFSADELLRRFDHYALEAHELVPAAAAAFAAQDAARLGEIVDRSQSAAEGLLSNQVPETSALARSARGLGAIAASAFGAGFGGSVWALVARSSARSFLRQWQSCYAATFPATAGAAEFFLSGAGPRLIAF
jgi:galactokinase